VPLKTPFKTALRTVEAVEDIVVMINTDTGHVGYDEAPATAVITGHAWLDPRDNPQLHLAAADRRRHRQPQSHHAADPGRDGKEHEREGGSGNRGIRPVRPAFWIYGIDVSLAHLAFAAALAVVLSLGAVGLPGQVSFMAATMPVTSAMGLPVEPLGLLLAVDTVPDVFATVGNVSADLVASRLVARGDGEAVIGAAPN
jgi:hypothetical protein